MGVSDLASTKSLSAIARQVSVGGVHRVAVVCGAIAERRVLFKAVFSVQCSVKIGSMGTSGEDVANGDSFIPNP